MAGRGKEYERVRNEGMTEDVHVVSGWGEREIEEEWKLNNHMHQSATGNDMALSMRHCV